MHRARRLHEHDGERRGESAEEGFQPCECGWGQEEEEFCEGDGGEGGEEVAEDQGAGLGEGGGEGAVAEDGGGALLGVMLVGGAWGLREREKKYWRMEMGDWGDRVVSCIGKPSPPPSPFFPPFSL